jgi:hypothetical protein
LASLHLNIPEENQNVTENALLRHSFAESQLDTLKSQELYNMHQSLLHSNQKDWHMLGNERLDVVEKTEKMNGRNQGRVALDPLSYNLLYSNQDHGSAGRDDNKQVIEPHAMHTPTVYAEENDCEDSAEPIAESLRDYRLY